MATTDPDKDLDSNLNQDATDDEVKLLTAEEPPDKEAPAATPPPVPSNEDHDEDDADTDATAKRDTEIEEAADEAAREAIRARRREERKNRKERGREKMESLERTVRALQEQNQTLAQQVGTIQSHTTGTQLQRLDQEIENSGKAVKHFMALIADAGTKGDGETLAQATEAMIEARDRERQLKAIKEQVTKRQAQPPAVDPQLVRHASAFIEKHKWYDPRGNDRDTQFMRVIDNEVMAAGFDPRTPAYYEELEKRGAQVLPHRFGASGAATPAATPGQPRKSPVAGSNGDGGGKPGGGADFALSAERVKAMKDSGAWDDPKRREKMIRDYRDYDKRAAAEKR